MLKINDFGALARRLMICECGPAAGVAPRRRAVFVMDGLCSCGFRGGAARVTTRRAFPSRSQASAFPIR
jgi:hypothetical protein